MRSLGRYLFLLVIIVLLLIELRSILQLFFTSLAIIIGDRWQPVGLVLLWTIVVLFDLFAICLLLCRCYRRFNRKRKIQRKLHLSFLSKGGNELLIAVASIIHIWFNILALVVVFSGIRSGLFYDTLGVVNVQTTLISFLMVCVWIINIVVIICFQIINVLKRFSH